MQCACDCYPYKEFEKEFDDVTTVLFTVLLAREEAVSEDPQ